MSRKRKSKAVWPLHPKSLHGSGGDVEAFRDGGAAHTFRRAEVGGYGFGSVVTADAAPESQPGAAPLIRRPG